MPSLPAAKNTRRALSPTEVVTALSQLEAWSLSGDGDEIAIVKTWRFANFHATMAFVNAVAFIAHQQDHHPDLSVHYQHCVVSFRTHDLKGLSALDFACAALVDALLPSRAAVAPTGQPT